MFRAILPLFCAAALLMPATDANADDLKKAANDLTQCRNLSDSEVRLACFDAAVDKLADALERAALPDHDSAVRRSPSVEEETASPTTGESKSTREDSPRPQKEQANESDSALPGWAAAPSKSESSDRDDPDSFEATIVRITRNNVGRHWFYTEDGAVWKQTQIEEIRPPKSLPAIAEFKEKLTGNPVIKFDVSNRAYRVRRVK